MFKSTPKDILATKGIKIQEKTWMKSQMSTMDSNFFMKKQKLDENCIKIR
jgi:hypothetical protein